jgi:hypothetical protein
VYVQILKNLICALDCIALTSIQVRAIVPIAALPVLQPKNVSGAIVNVSFLQIIFAMGDVSILDQITIIVMGVIYHVVRDLMTLMLHWHYVSLAFVNKYAV